MSEKYNIYELAEKTEIPDTTVRRYISKFKKFFIHTGGTRSRRYDESAVNVLLRIKSLYDGGFESEEVAKILGKEFPMIMDGEEPKKKPEKHIMAVSVAPEDIEAIKQGLAEQKEFNQLMTQKFADQERFYKESLENQKRYFEKLLKDQGEREQQLIELITEKEEEKEETTEPVIEKVPEPVAEKPEKRGLWKRLFK